MWFFKQLFGSRASKNLSSTDESDVKTENNTNKLSSQVNVESAADEPAKEPTPASCDRKSVNSDKVLKDLSNFESSIKNIYHLIVLDESGSMSGITQQTISGCNETIQTIKIMQENNKDTQKHFVSIYLFDSSNSRYIIKDVYIGKVREITSKDYRPNACTPLFDALGLTLTTLKTTIEKEKSIAYVTIITDGYENASREYSLEKVQALIDDLKKQDVIFSFIGANVDSTSYAQSLHINNAMQFDQTDEGARGMWERERKSKLSSSSKLRMFSKFNMCEAENFGATENRGYYYSEEVPANRISPSPKDIKSLQENEIFVFGGNIDGSHNGGGAYMARECFGAIVGQAEGRQGQSYAIPALGASEEELFHAIDHFCDYAKSHPELIFIVSPFGNAYIVGPMFRRASQIPNVKLPIEFWDYNDFSGAHG